MQLWKYMAINYHLSVWYLINKKINFLFNSATSETNQSVIFFTPNFSYLCRLHKLYFQNFSFLMMHQHSPEQDRLGARKPLGPIVYRQHRVFSTYISCEFFFAQVDLGRRYLNVCLPVCGTARPSMSKEGRKSTRTTNYCPSI